MMSGWPGSGMLPELPILLLTVSCRRPEPPDLSTLIGEREEGGREDGKCCPWFFKKPSRLEVDSGPWPMPLMPPMPPTDPFLMICASTLDL